jgi:hypothetical protein
MFRNRKKEELGEEFRARAGKFVAVSDHDGLLEVFSQYSAQAGMVEGELGLEYMEEVLAEVFQQPLQRIRRDWFDHI